MSKSTNIVFIKQNKTDKDGTIYIRSIENRITTKKSLKIKVKVKEWNDFFNPNTKRFKKDKRFPQYELINQRIEEHLTELSKFGNDINSIPSEKKLFIMYWEKKIKNSETHGTSIKHQTTTANEVKDWDSLNHFHLVVALEKHFKIKFTSSEIQNWKMLEKCVKL